jgi:ADP-ribose pyrophosphatase
MPVEHAIIHETSEPFGPFRISTGKIEVTDGGCYGVRVQINRVSLDPGDSVAVLVYDPKDDAILLVKQWRYPVTRAGDDGFILEIPAGKLNGGEDREAAAAREVTEELGVTVTALDHIASFFVSPGCTSERIHLAYAEVAEKVSEGGGLAEEHEHIEVIRMPRHLFLGKVVTGHINDAKTLVAGLWLANQEPPHDR